MNRKRSDTEKQEVNHHPFDAFGIRRYRGSPGIQCIPSSLRWDLGRYYKRPSQRAQCLYGSAEHCGCGDRGGGDRRRRPQAGAAQTAWPSAPAAIKCWRSASQTTSLTDTSSAGTVTALREAAHSSLYALANSNAAEKGTGTPAWVITFFRHRRAPGRCPAHSRVLCHPQVQASGEGLSGRRHPKELTKLLCAREPKESVNCKPKTRAGGTS